MFNGMLIVFVPFSVPRAIISLLSVLVIVMFPLVIFCPVSLSRTVTLMVVFCIVLLSSLAVVRDCLCVMFIVWLMVVVLYVSSPG